MIQCEDLHFDYGSKPILRGANFHVQPGELAALLGRNGSGKSTTLRLLRRAAAGIGIHHFGSWLFLPILALWALSLWICGKRLDRRL